MTESNEALLELSIALDHLHIVENSAQELETIKQIAARRSTTVVAFFNQFAFNLAAAHAGFRQALVKSDFLFRDGVGIEVCLAALGRTAGINQNGTDFIPKLLRATAGRRLAVYGTTDEWLSKACSRLVSEGSLPISTLDGFRSVVDYIEDVRRSKPSVVLLGMGMPKQELVAMELARLGGEPILIICGGAILDFFAGRFPRAPEALRRLRLEWLFRLYQEPKRLVRRYLVGGLVFLWSISKLKRFRRRSSAMENQKSSDLNDIDTKIQNSHQRERS